MSLLLALFSLTAPAHAGEQLAIAAGDELTMFDYAAANTVRTVTMGDDIVDLERTDGGWYVFAKTGSWSNQDLERMSVHTGGLASWSGLTAGDFDVGSTVRLVQSVDASNDEIELYVLHRAKSAVDAGGSVPRRVASGVGDLTYAWSSADGKLYEIDVASNTNSPVAEFSDFTVTDLVVDPRGNWVVCVGIEPSGNSLDVYVGAYSRATGNEYALQIGSAESPGGVGFFSDGSFVVGTRGGVFQVELAPSGDLEETLVPGAPSESAEVIDIGTSVDNDQVFALYEDRVDRMNSSSGYLDSEALSLTNTPTELVVVPPPAPSVIGPRPWFTGLLKAMDKLEITAEFRAPKKWRVCAKCDDEEVEEAQDHFETKLKGETELSADDVLDLLSVSGSSEAELRQLLDLVAFGDD